MPPAPNVKYAEMSIAVVGNAGAGKRGILGTLKYYIEDEKAAHTRTGDHEEKDVGHVLDNGIVRRDMSRRKGTLKGASLPPFGAWRETLCTASEAPPPPAVPHCHRRLKEAESHHRNDGGGDGDYQHSGGMGLVESGYNTTEDGDVEEDEEYHFKTQQELQEEARAKAKLEVKKRRKRIMGEGGSEDDNDDEAITSDTNNNDDDAGKKRKKKSSSGADDPTAPAATRYHFPLKITYGIPNALARVTDSELRKHDGIVVVVDASTWDQDKGSFENIFKCFAFECKTWPIIHKVIMLTKCDRVLAGCTLSNTTTKKKDKKKEKKGESSQDDATTIPSTPATIAELHRISLELENILLETKAMPKRDDDVVEDEDVNSTTTTKKGTRMLPNGAIFECSAETGVNVVRGFHHLAALIRQGRTGPQNTCCVIA